MNQKTPQISDPDLFAEYMHNTIYNIQEGGGAKAFLRLLSILHCHDIHDFRFMSKKIEDCIAISLHGIILQRVSLTGDP